MTSRCEVALKAGVSKLSQFLLKYCNDTTANEPALITMVYQVLCLALGIAMLSLGHQLLSLLSQIGLLTVF